MGNQYAVRSSDPQQIQVTRDQSLFLRTGNTQDFAFAKSVSEDMDPVHGLPHARGYAEHVHQNPICEIDNIKWFDNLDAVWEL